MNRCFPTIDSAYKTYFMYILWGMQKLSLLEALVEGKENKKLICQHTKCLKILLNSKIINQSITIIRGIL